MVNQQAAQRMFLGIQLPESIRHSVAQAADNLRREGVNAGNWSPPSLYHLTVLFLGETQPEQWRELSSFLPSITASVTPFTLTLNTVGAFVQNRILWMGLFADEGRDALTGLHAYVVAGVRKRLPELADRLDSRPYAPHLTLARKLDSESWRAYLREHDEACADTSLHDVPWSGGFLTFPVGELCLFKSVRIEGQLQYPVIDAFALAGLQPARSSSTKK